MVVYEFLFVTFLFKIMFVRYIGIFALSLASSFSWVCVCVLRLLCVRVCVF